ncbi:hypothetical protein AXF42_Ash012821 [Apostasia shenzhenica]|uniref:DUF868 domain-containing protein n=1 Tax=Apostasia shenzhenica TaxID=1088818 RepID=A0A2I0AM96_9ASPA|nr:hypothetical protein AXF42_Ash012821 [Apostasia shenzhenica]
MQDFFPVPSCFSSAGKGGELASAAAEGWVAPAAAIGTKHGQSVVALVYRTKIAGHCRPITVTWCRNLLARILSISVDSGGDGDYRGNGSSSCRCKLEMRAWHFWRRHGTKRFEAGGKPVDVFWDLREAKFSGEDSPEPLSGYYVAVVSGEEVVLLLGDLKKEAFLRTGYPPAIIDAALVSRKEHVFGKKRFVTRAKFHEKGGFHELSIECTAGAANAEAEMEIKIDGGSGIRVRHLQWKFRGNESLTVSRVRVEVYWDVHGWLFSPASGLRHALFIFRPTPAAAPATSSSSLSALLSDNGGGYSDFCLFLHAWKI